MPANMNATAAEPFLPDVLSDRLESLVVDLPLAAGQFAGRLAPQVRAAVGELVRSMNCYYSNLIEEHDTHPHDIERWRPIIRRTRPSVPCSGGRAHIEVQQMIDEDQAPNVSPLTREFILWTHREFCRRLPDELLWVEDPEREGEIPGDTR